MGSMRCLRGRRGRRRERRVYDGGFVFVLRYPACEYVSVMVVVELYASVALLFTNFCKNSHYLYQQYWRNAY